MFVVYPVAALLWATVVIPQMDGIVLRIIQAFRPSFVPYGRLLETIPLETSRQAMERMVYRTLLVIGHLLLLWPLLIVSLLSLMARVSWMAGLNAVKYAPQIWMIPQAFMAAYLLFYYIDMVKGALMLNKTHQIELVKLTHQLWRDREGEM